MRKSFVAMCLAALFALSACGQASGPAEEQIDQMPTAEELGMPLMLGFCDVCWTES